jgi:hypothetical protein
MWSHSGGLSGACSYHGGESNNIYTGSGSTGSAGSSNGSSSGSGGDLGPGNGYTVTFADGTISHSGGIQGACSHHGGDWIALRGPTSSNEGETMKRTIITHRGSDPSVRVHIGGRRIARKLARQWRPNLKRRVSVLDLTRVQAWQARSGGPLLLEDERARRLATGNREPGPGRLCLRQADGPPSQSRVGDRC